MIPQNFKAYFQQKNIKAISVILLALIITTLGFMTITIAMMLNKSTIYEGVYINGHAAGKLTTQELTDLLNKSYKDKVKTTQLVLDYKGKVSKLNFSDIGVSYDIIAAVQKAYEYGRKGTLTNRLSEIFKAKNSGFRIELAYKYDQNKLDSLLADIGSKYLKPVKQAELSITGDKITVHSGHAGEELDRVVFMENIKDSISKCQALKIAIPVRTVKPEKINIEEYYSQITRAPADAYTRVENNTKVTVVPHVTGRSVDKNLLKEIVFQAEKTENSQADIPFRLIAPKQTENEVKAKLFKNLLSTWKTSFNTNTEIEKNRAQNIKLAVAKINGRILAPGEIFSFNNAVGKRTEQAGFKDAYIYVDGKVLPGLGGGICQVSTTLYNSILPLGFQVIERRNHGFTVNYSELGMDAAVAYGQVDFKFRNSSEWPIKIYSSVTADNKVVFSIAGTDEGNMRRAEYESKLVKTVENSVRYITDPTLEEGKTKVKQKGSKGYTVDTYKIIKKDGMIIGRTKIYTSYYKPLDKEILKGTKKTVKK
ncbi:MAG: VanW family protein [Clostridia bacterium]|nr:VanW family protein [Clostridia bacterium]